MPGSAGEYQPVGAGSGAVSSGGGGSGSLTVGTTTVTGGTDNYALTVGGGTLGDTPIRTILTANTNFYVATTGSDSNPGTLASPWATLQHAMDFISGNIDFAGLIVNGNVGPGTFVGIGIKSTVGDGVLQWLGAGPASTTIIAGNNDGVYNFGDCVSVNVTCDSVIALDGFNWRATVNMGFAIYAPAVVGFFGNFSTNTSNNSIDATPMVNGTAFFEITTVSVMSSAPGTCNITGGSAAGAWAIALGGGRIADFVTWVWSGTFTADPAYLVLESSSDYLALLGVSHTGAGVTGPRVSLMLGSSAGSDPGSRAGLLGPTFFLGNTFGTVDASSSYDGFPGPLPGIDTQTGNPYVLAIGDAYGIVEMNNAGANTVTVPTNASVAFEIGTKIQVTQIGAGATTIAGAGGVVVHNAGALSGQWGSAMLYKRGTDEWVQTNA